MHLKSIKLAGFKSFVDPTTVSFSSNLVGVVGPNGCGKSNVIDAVRWVMGETSARQLRGDSMADVIFNGSSSRKPVGQGSIELVFDNSGGRIVGEYASYNEISLRRRVTRDGQSDYFLNGSKCRRRDITDIFLGTGLGPRSYSIIEQGMISSLITARPEDLRVYIEEAAGVSKYKERRRDTENRIRRTRENLERLTDLRDELGRQLQRLHRQSRAAEKYREYKREERDLNRQLLALQWQVIDAEARLCKESVASTESEVEKLVVLELACNTEIEKQRQAINEKTDAFNAVQSKYYEAGEEIARLEQTIKHREERERQRAEDITQTEQSFAETQSHLQNDRAKVDGWTAELEELARQRMAADALVEQSSVQLEELENRSATAQEAWDQFQTSAADTGQSAEVEQSRIKHLEQSMGSIAARRDRIRSQSGDESVAVIADQSESLSAQKTELEKELRAANEREESETRSIADTRSRLNEWANELDTMRSDLQRSRGRLASLEALQEAAMNAGQAGVENWLQANDLGNAPRLADEMDVEPGWELAIETVLGGTIRAVKVPAINSIASRLSAFGDGVLELVDSAGIGNADPARLSSRARGSAVSSLLGSVFVAEDLNAAINRRTSLKSGESVITREGIWLGANWCRVGCGEAVAPGVIERKAEIDSLSASIAQAEKSETEKRESMARKQADLQAREEQRRDARRQKEALATDLSATEAQISALNARHEQLLQQLQHSKTELAAADEQYQLEQRQLAAARIALADALDAIKDHRGRRDQLIQAREESRSRLGEVRNQHQQQARNGQQLAMREQMVSTQLSSLNETIERMKGQLQRLAERRESLRASPESPEDSPAVPIAEALDERLEARLEIEQKLTIAREDLQATEQAVQNREARRQQHQHSLLQVREKLQDQRLQAQDLMTRSSTVEEQLGDADPGAIVADLPEGASASDWSQHLEAMRNRIQRLGPINLAAIDEYKSESERKEYLDEQNNELVEALETLETAIRKIDRETRTRFKETFDKIDAGFKELFPGLFGGGHAYLKLTDDDLLATGVTIMARPPGKRNSTIHLLSGGEKAMTAIALIFAIFHLNPAPFCLLDEVDAPLDDANAGRFAKMLCEMSEKVQFIFVTHNKITMEIADQLIGVTMHEPGVSRLVTVDVESAIKMAALASVKH